MMKIYFSILFLIFCHSYLLANTSDTAWSLFVNVPNSDNYEKCSRMINDSLNGPYPKNVHGEKTNTPIHNKLFSDYNLYAKYLKLVRAANPYAVNLAFQLYPLTDGAVSEDLFGATSMIVKKKPELFLSMLKKYNIEEPILIDKFVSSLPVDEFVDRTDKRIVEIEKRIEALKTVNKSDLIAFRDQCIEQLTKDLKFYMRHKDN